MGVVNDSVRVSDEWWRPMVMRPAGRGGGIVVGGDIAVVGGGIVEVVGVGGGADTRVDLAERFVAAAWRCALVVLLEEGRWGEGLGGVGGLFRVGTAVPALALLLLLLALAACPTGLYGLREEVGDGEQDQKDRHADAETDAQADFEGVAVGGLSGVAGAR